jgi:hypothetical protein
MFYILVIKSLHYNNKKHFNAINRLINFVAEKRNG